MSSFVRQFPMTTLSTQFVKELIVLGLVLTNIVSQCHCATSPNRHGVTGGVGGAGSSVSETNRGGGSNDNSGSTSKLGVYMLRSPESTVAPQGDEVQFECELNLEPERLDWRFRPLDSLGDKDDYIYLHKNHSYNVTNKDGTSKLRVYVNQKSVGEYQCIAWFGASSLASIPAKLMLASISLDNSYNDDFFNERPMTMRRIASPPSSVHWKISPGNSIILKCGNVISYPPPDWSFFKDNNPVPANIPQLQTGGLILSQLSSKDSGTYWCSAVNSITGTELKIPQKTTILVDYTPRTAPIFLTIPSTSVAVKPGSTAVLECPGIGNPVPKAVWSRPDASMHNNRTSDLGYGLQIVDVKHHDQGNYVCHLDNGIAPALVHQVQLIVLDAPDIIEPPRATLTNENDELELHCVAKGSPRPEIYWMINGFDTRWDPLIYSNGSTLIIKSVEKKHAGIVQCFARNIVSEVSGSNLLQVNPKQISGSAVQPLGSVPQSTKVNNEHGKARQRKKHKHPIMIPPSRPSVTRLSDESVMVRWSVPLNDGLPIQFFKVQYRMLANPNKGKMTRSQWMTANEDIAPHVCSYEVNNLKPDHYYRFRIAAVYSNNDNKLGNTSGKFHLQRGAQLGPAKSSLVAPTLTRIEPAAETAIIIHWEFPQNPPNSVDGFYAYYRASTSAGEYAKATVDGMGARHFKIDHLEAGTAYEFKLQSFTSSAASDFSAILTGKTLKPPTPPPVIPTVIAASESTQHSNSMLPFIAGAAGLLAVVLLVLILLCVAIKRRKNNREDDITENKSHPDHIQADSNGFAGSNGRVMGASPMHKTSRLNGVVSRMNITPNPLAQDGDKLRNQRDCSRIAM